MTSASFYDGKVHGSYFDMASVSSVPVRYSTIVGALRDLDSRVLTPLLEVGLETPHSSLFLLKALGVDADMYSGFDVSAKSVDLVRAAGLKVSQLDISTDRLPLDDGSISLAIMAEVVEHLVDPDHAVQECRRVLRRGGLLVITTPNLASWFNRVLLPLGVQPIHTEVSTEWNFGRRELGPRTRPVGHLRIFTLSALLELLEYYGFGVLSVRGVPSELFAHRSHIVSFVDHALATFPGLASGLLVISEKR